jgi:multisubunit Na+/H+ antiporter MnhC subunit
LVAVIAIFSIWANQQLLDTDGRVSASAKALESTVVRHRVEDFIADEVVHLAGGPTRSQAAIPPALRGRLRDGARKLSDQVLASARFRVIWQRANRIAHRAVVRVLEEKGRDHGEGRVSIDLTPAVRDAVGSVGGEELRSLVRPGSAEIEVLEAHELEDARDAVRVVRHLPVPATVVAILLWALALFLGRARPWRTLAGVGLSLVLAGVLALIVRAVAGHEIVDRLLTHSADRAAAEAAWHILTSLIVDLSVGAIVLGAALLAAATIGGGDLAGRLRRRRVAG